MNIMRDDYLQYVKREVSSWEKHCLGESTVHLDEQSSETATYTDLELAYLAVCRLDNMVGTETIHSRMALIRLHREYVRTCESWTAEGSNLTDVGRGNTSFIIDHILQRIHTDWESLDETARGALRARFHNQKRFGKRWVLVVEALGPGILLICSQKLANMM
jgi:hypothetical protein